MSKPLIVSYTSDHGIYDTSYHVIDEINYNKNSSPNTTVSASIYLDKSSYQSSKTALRQYHYKFDLGGELTNNIISQSYDELKGYSSEWLVDSDNKNFNINFSSSAIYDS